MSTDRKPRKRYLSPVERISEILFGLIMTLSFTGTMSVVSGGREEVGVMLLAVLGCNIAWGVIDGILYLLGAVSERGREHALRHKLATTEDPELAKDIISEALPPSVAEVLQRNELESIRQRLAAQPHKERHKMLTGEDLGGFVGVFIFVVLSCIPILIPFIVIQDPWRALRVSNGVAIVMLFLGGYSLAKYAGLPKTVTGLVMVVLGAAMVGLTIALGG